MDRAGAWGMGLRRPPAPSDDTAGQHHCTLHTQASPELISSSVREARPIHRLDGGTSLGFFCPQRPRLHRECRLYIRSLPPVREHLRSSRSPPTSVHCDPPSQDDRPVDIAGLRCRARYPESALASPLLPHPPHYRPRSTFAVVN